MTAAMPTRDAAAFDRRFTMHRLWASQAPEAMLSDVAPRIRGIAAGGPMRIDGPLMDRLPRLEIVASFGAGYERVDVEAAAVRGITVTNTPGVLTEEVADLAMAVMLSTIRRIPQADRFVREGKWLSGRFPLSASLQGRKIGIVGLGRIGKAIARRCAAFGVDVHYHGRTEVPDSGYRFCPTLLELARTVDVMILSTPGDAGTHGMVDAPVLAALGPDGILVNVSRGSVVDQDALVAALRDRKILAAGLDVFADEPEVPAELIAMDNVVLTPHVGSSSLRTWQNMSQLVLDNLTAWFEERGPLTPVVATRKTNSSEPDRARTA
ncbi:MAG: 2-hydroxyacid dehydrogenase [Rhodoplanes sp.]|nr:2-hydroxyacid dehydrogenase [Rhodoplanes sp.]